MFCPQCGAPNEDDAVFCGNCGAVLDEDQVSAEEQAEAPETEPVVEEMPEEEPLAVEVPAEPPLPPPPQPVAAQPSLPTSGLALASLILGIGGLTILPLIGSILAIIFGYMARRDIRQKPGQLQGDGLAVAGIVMGWIAVALAVIGLVIGGGFMLCGVCGALGTSSY